MSRARWCAGRRAIRFEVETGSGTHRISWVRGSLVLHDHADLEGERVLEALGGERCACLHVLDACRELGPRPVARPPGPAPVQAARAQVRGGPQFAALQATAPQRPQPGRRWQLVLRQLPQPMLDVLGAVFAVRRQRQVDVRPPRRPVPAEERLQAAVVPACREAMRRARRDLRSYASLTVECSKRGPGEGPLLHGSLDGSRGTLTLSLPVSWLNRVWSRGLAVVGGHFVLDVDRPAPATELQGTAVCWERRAAGRSVPAAVPCSLTWDRVRGWDLTW